METTATCKIVKYLTAIERVAVIGFESAILSGIAAIAAAPW